MGLKKPTNGKAPKLRLTKPEDAYMIAATLVKAAIPRIEKGRMVRGLLDGNPPYAPSRLRLAAQDWRANFNTLEGRSISSNAKTPYYDLFSASSPMVEVDLDTDDSARERWNLVVAEEFHRFMYRYSCFEPNLWAMLDDFVVFNKGFFHWNHPTDPYFKRMEWWRVMFPNGTGIDPDEWNMFALRQYFTVTKLWELSGSGDGAGWTKEAVVGAIKRATPLQPTSEQAQGIEIQQMLKDCDIALSARSEVIRAVSIFVREYDGTWSWVMVEEDAALTMMAEHSTEPEPEVPQFMFRRDRFFNDPREVIAPFIYEVEEGSINAFAGLGKYLYQLLRSKDRLEMGLIDGAFLRQYPTIQPMNASSSQRAALMQQVGSCNILAPGAEVVQSGLLADLSGSIAVMEHLDRLVESNTAIFKPRLEKPAGNPETATAVNLRFQNATVLTNSAVNRFYAQGDQWIEEVWRRATATFPESSKRPGIKSALLFQKCCEKRGVPMKVLKKAPYHVRLSRVIGNGSPFARQQAVGSLAMMAPEMGPRGRRAYQDDFVSAFAGGNKVERYFPRDDVLNQPDSNTWMAEQENGYMNDEGLEPTITDGQDHKTHLQVHGSAMSAAVQSAMQGGEIPKVLIFLGVALPHCGKHISYLTQPEQKQWTEALKPIEQAFEMLQGEYQKQQQQQMEMQAQQQQMLSQQNLDMLKIQLDAQRKDQKQAFTFQQKAVTTQQNMALADAKTASEISRQNAKAGADIRRANVETAADIRRNDAQTETE